MTLVLPWKGPLSPQLRGKLLLVLHSSAIAILPFQNQLNYLLHLLHTHSVDHRICDHPDDTDHIRTALRRTPDSEQGIGAHHFDLPSTRGVD